VPKDLKERVCAILDKHNDLRWDVRRFYR